MKPTRTPKTKPAPARVKPLPKWKAHAHWNDSFVIYPDQLPAMVEKLSKHFSADPSIDWKDDETFRTYSLKRKADRLARARAALSSIGLDVKANK